MLKPKWILDVEESYERLGAIESLGSLKINSSNEMGNTFLSWLIYLHQRNLNQFFMVGYDLIKKNLSTDEQVFVLSWMIVGYEVKYDLPKRAVLIDQLRQIALEDPGYYADSMLAYFDGVTFYFTSDLDAAEVKFNLAISLFEKNGDMRGVARAHFHLSLVNQLRSLVKEVKTNIKLCLDICSYNNFYKTKKKALDFYMEIHAAGSNAETIFNHSSADLIDSLIEQLSVAVLRKDCILVKRLLYQAEKLRRQQGFARGRFSLFKYVIKLNFLASRSNLAYLQLSFLKDPLILCEIFDWMIENDIPLRPCDEKRKQKQDFLVRKVNSSVKCTTASYQIIRLLDIPKKDVSRLVNYLYIQDKSCSKEQIFEHVYEVVYDPIIHDPKLYQLILKTKKNVAQDVLINHYGEYSFNRKKYKLVQ